MPNLTLYLTNLHIRTACRRGHPYVPGSFLTKTVTRKTKTYEVRECILCRRLRESPTARAKADIPPRQSKNS